MVKRHDILKELDIIKSWKENELKSSKTVPDDDENDSDEDSENEAYDKRFFVFQLLKCEQIQIFCECNINEVRKLNDNRAHFLKIFETIIIISFKLH